MTLLRTKPKKNNPFPLFFCFVYTGLKLITLLNSISFYLLTQCHIQLCFCSRKKIEEIGKMTALSQDEIVSNTRTVIQGLDTLKNDYQQILNTLLSSMKTIKRENGDTNLVEEKTNILQRSLETIELGLGEGQVGSQVFFLLLSVSMLLYLFFLYITHYVMTKQMLFLLGIHLKKIIHD